MKPVQHVCIFGAGAMGSVYASIFYQMDPDCITLLAGGERYHRLQSEGLRVNGQHYPVRVVSPEDKSPPADLIMVGLKHHQLADAVAELKNRIDDHTSIISVMNGIESEEFIGAVYGMDRLLFSAAVGIDALRTDGDVRCSSQGKLYFGEPVNDPVSERVLGIQAFFDRAGIVYETPADMIRILWWKFMINVGINQSSAVLRAPFGTFQKSTEAAHLMQSAMQEVIRIAQAKNIDLRAEDIDQWNQVMEKLPADGKTSMLQDLEAGRKTEVEMFAGRMLKMGHALKIPTPVNQVLFDIIRVIEVRL